MYIYISIYIYINGLNHCFNCKYEEESYKILVDILQTPAASILALPQPTWGCQGEACAPVQDSGSCPELGSC